MDYCVYILYSSKRERYYVGHTQDFESRLVRHNMGLVKSTKGGKPWIKVRIIHAESRSEAMRLEKKIKKRGIKRFLEDNQFGV